MFFSQVEFRRKYFIWVLASASIAYTPLVPLPFALYALTAGTTLLTAGTSLLTAGTTLLTAGTTLLTAGTTLLMAGTTLLFSLRLIYVKNHQHLLSVIL